MNVPTNITVLALDVDGVLTNGLIAISNMGEPTKSFHAHDGLGISLWQKSGFIVVLISGRNEACVNTRAKELHISHVIQGSKDKVHDLTAVLETLGKSKEEVCFIGDDLGDIAVMRHSGYSIAVHNAAEEVKQTADWTTSKPGGEGAVREAIEYLMNANGTWENAVSSLLTEHANQ